MDTVMITVFYCPLAVISATTSLLIHQLCKAGSSARRVGARDPRSSILAVILTACLFLVQITPNTISTLGEFYRSTSTLLYRGGVVCSQLYIMGNFFIYCLAVPSFRSFLGARLQKFTTHLSLQLRSYLPLPLSASGMKL